MVQRDVGKAKRCVSNVIDKAYMFNVKQRENRAKRVARLIDTAAASLDRCNKHASWAWCPLCDPDNKPD